MKQRIINDLNIVFSKEKKETNANLWLKIQSLVKKKNCEGQKIKSLVKKNNGEYLAFGEEKEKLVATNPFLVRGKLIKND